MNYLDITTQIGCRVNCTRYCPQELIAAKHPGVQPLTLEAFKYFIKDVPEEIQILFAGQSEPFQNQECTDMIRWAQQQGHSIQVNSTLVGLSVSDAKRLIQVPIDRFLLHLPDAFGISKIPVTEEYLEVLGIVLTGIPNLSFMNMGGFFVSCGVEDMHRDPGKCKKRAGGLWCEFLESPNYSVTPDGNVYFCCRMRGISGKVGSLYENTYPELVAKFPEESRKIRKTHCCICTNAKSIWKQRAIEIKCRVLGTDPIFPQVPQL